MTGVRDTSKTSGTPPSRSASVSSFGEMWRGPLAHPIGAIHRGGRGRRGGIGEDAGRSLVGIGVIGRKGVRGRCSGLRGGAPGAEEGKLGSGRLDSAAVTAGAVVGPAGVTGGKLEPRAASRASSASSRLRLYSFQHSGHLHST